jgi:hypothetical protein
MPRGAGALGLSTPRILNHRFTPALNAGEDAQSRLKCA